MIPAFTNAAMLMGLAGLAVPVLIHLLFRRKSQRMRFSTVRFFVKKDERSHQKRKLKNLILLSLRLLVMLLVVLGFVRPYLPGSGGESNVAGRRHVVLVVDTSLSMRAETSRGSQWARVRQAALGMVEEMRNEDRVAVVVSGGVITNLSGWVEPRVAGEALRTLEVGGGRGDLLEGVGRAGRYFDDLRAVGTREVRVFSDLQRLEPDALAHCAIPEDVKVSCFDVGERFIPNFAVSDVSLAGEEGSGAAVSVRSYSDEPEAQSTLRVRVDGRELLSRDVRLGAGATSQVALGQLPFEPGWHSVAVELAIRDGLLADNTRYQTVYRPEPVRVWAVETRADARVFQEATFFLRTALDPSVDTTNRNTASAFRVTKVPLARLVGELERDLSEVRRRPEVLFVSSMRDIPNGLGAILMRHVSEGGGLVMFLGEAVRSSIYNRELGGLLPAGIGEMEVIAAGEMPWRVGAFDKRSAMFEAFLKPNSGDVRLAEFYGRRGLVTSQEGRTVAEFDDGAPLIVEKSVGAGRVVLVNTSEDLRMGDWPRHKSYVPWVHGLASGLVRRTGEEAARVAPGYVLGEEIDLDLGGRYAGQTLRLEREGKDGGVEVQVASSGWLKDLAVGEAGSYRIRTTKGEDAFRFSVNVDPNESDLSLMSPAEVETRLGRVPAQVNTGFGVWVESTGRGQEFWRALLWAALALLVLEPLVANRMTA